MADTADLTVEILKQIRDGIGQTNARLDQTNVRLDQMREELLARIDQTNGRLDGTNARLDGTHTRLDQHERLLVRLVDESQVHTRTLVRLISEVEGTNRRVDHVLTGPMGQDVREHTARITALEADVAALKRRAG